MAMRDGLNSATTEAKSAYLCIWTLFQLPAIGNILHFRNARGRKIYGRGSVDDKGPAVACLYGMKAVMDAGLPMSNHVRIIAGTDEETFARGIHYYLERENAPAYGFSPDAEFPIIYAEKGIIRFGYRLPLALPDKNILSIHAGTRLNVVPSLAEARVAGITAAEVGSMLASRTDGHRFNVLADGGIIRIISHGVPSHASYPSEGYNAIQGLLSLLASLFPNSSDPLKVFLRRLNRSFLMETDGHSWGIACKDEVSGALTCNMAILESGKDEAIVKFDIRYPVTHDSNKLTARLEAYSHELGLNTKYELVQHKNRYM